MRITFFKIPSHRRFQHNPIYYDEAKEKRIERERRIRSEMGLEPIEGDESVSFEDRIKGKIRESGIKSNFEVSRSIRRKSNFRLFVILIILFALFYLILQSGFDLFGLFFK